MANKRFTQITRVATSFSSGDVIPLGNASLGDGQMPQGDLLRETAQNAIADNLVPAFDQTKLNDAGGYAYYAGEIVAYQGATYKFKVNHSSGVWNAAEVDRIVAGESLKFFVVRSNPEYIYAFTDKNGVFLFGIKNDGSIEWAVGVPQPIKNWVQNFVNAAIAVKVDKETGKSLINSVFANGVNVVENDEFVYAVTDADNKLLFGSRKDGSFEWSKGIPEFLRRIIDSKVDKIDGKGLIDSNVSASLHITQNDMYLFAITDDNNNVLFGIDKNGLPVISEEVKSIIISYFTQKNNTPYLFAVIDDSDTVLFSIDKFGKSSIDDQVRATLIDFFSKTSADSVFALTDSEGRVLLAFRGDGSINCCAIEELINHKFDEAEFMDYSYVDTKVADEKTRAEAAELELKEAIDNLNPTTVIGGENNPDEEFLTSINDKITLKNRYIAYNGYKRVYLRQNDDFANVVVDTNTEYVVSFSHNINNASVTIPTGCSLRFEGGCVYGGTIIGQNTRFSSNSIKCFGTQLTLGGTWVAPIIKTSYLINSSSDNIVKSLLPLLNPNVLNEFIIDTDVYFLPTADKDSFITLVSNTKLVVEKTITVKTNQYPHYQTIFADNASNIEICGGGKLVGDTDTHDYTTVTSTHEWCHGIALMQVTNAYIHDIEITGFPGDGSELDGHGQLNSKNVTFDRFKINHCGRQGISLCGVSNITVRNGVITDIYRTAPKAAIDIEPWQSGRAENISIENVIAEDTFGFDICYCSNVRLNNVHTTHSKLALFKDCDNVVVENASTNELTNGAEMFKSEGSVANCILRNVVSNTNNLIYCELSGIKIDSTDNFGSEAVISSGPADGSTKFENGSMLYFNGTTWQQF